MISLLAALALATCNVSSAGPDGGQVFCVDQGGAVSADSYTSTGAVLGFSAFGGNGSASLCDVSASCTTSYAEVLDFPDTDAGAVFLNAGTSQLGLFGNASNGYLTVQLGPYELPDGGRSLVFAIQSSGGPTDDVLALSNGPGMWGNLIGGYTQRVGDGVLIPSGFHVLVSGQVGAAWADAGDECVTLQQLRFILDGGAL